MSSLHMKHLEDGQALRYLDGELPRRKAHQVREHLEACWQCRAELNELQATVADCVKYRKHVLGTCLPAPPEPWKDLTREFDRIDAALARRSVFARLAHFLALRDFVPAVRWSAASLLLIAIAASTFYQLHDTPSVQAAILLQRAVAVAERRPRTLRRVRIDRKSVV